MSGQRGRQIEPSLYGRVGTPRAAKQWDSLTFYRCSVCWRLNVVGVGQPRESSNCEHRREVWA